MMKKLSVLFITTIVCVLFNTKGIKADPPLDRYGGHYSVVPDTSPYTLTYRFYVDPGQTGVNDFEYRSIMDDIYTLWGSTAVSECGRWRMLNALLEHRVDPYITYPVGVFRDTVPFDDTSLVYFSTSVAVALNLISTGTIDYTVRYSTIQICQEGGPFQVTISTS